MSSEGTEAVPGRILVVDDEPDMVSSLKVYLKRLKYRVETAGNAEQALEKLQEEPADLVLSDLMLPGHSGLELLERVKERWPETIVMLITGYATVETAVQAIRLGAFDYIPKPFTPQQLEVAVSRVFRHKALADENRSLKKQIRDRARVDSLLGFSEPMKRIQSLVTRVASTEAGVLIIGESGTGKEVVARALHAHSRRADKPFVPLDCAALPLNLLESELFGYERGAFTGANTSRVGLLEAAHLGTFFMDEIGELEQSIQVKLLRVLQERQFRRVGGSKQLSVDVRLIAATNRDLEKEVKAGRFREDLYHRLNVIQIRLPPLRERLGDIPLLVHHFLQIIGQQMGKPFMQVAPDAMTALEAYAWPGNVRELQNAIAYGVSMSEGNMITPLDLPQTLQEQSPVPSSRAIPVGELAGQPLQVHHELPYKKAKRLWLERFEEAYFRELLKRHDNNISHAARAAEIDRKSIQRILKKTPLDLDQADEDDEE